MHTGHITPRTRRTTFRQRTLRAHRSEKRETLRWGIIMGVMVVMIIAIVVSLITQPKHNLSQLTSGASGSVQFSSSAQFNSPSSSPSISYEEALAVNSDGVPAYLYVSGQQWSINKVNQFADVAGKRPGKRFGGFTLASTFCDEKVIAYIQTEDPMQLRTDLMHEVFHAGACVHGGARWWNSSSDKDHQGIYHLGEFWAQFVRDNPVFMRWAGQGGG